MKRKTYINPEIMSAGTAALAILSGSPYRQSTEAADLQEEAEGVELGSNKTNLWDEVSGEE